MFQASSAAVVGEMVLTPSVITSCTRMGAYRCRERNRGTYPRFPSASGITDPTDTATSATPTAAEWTRHALDGGNRCAAGETNKRGATWQF